MECEIVEILRALSKHTTAFTFVRPKTALYLYMKSLFEQNEYSLQSRITMNGFIENNVTEDMQIGDVLRLINNRADELEKENLFSILNKVPCQ